MMAGGDESSRWVCRPGMGLAVAALLCCLAGTARGDFEADQKECSESLSGLFTCLDYVEGTSRAPPPDCCSGLNHVVSTKPRCLCILIKDRNDPHLRFKVNVTRARSLPASARTPSISSSALVTPIAPPMVPSLFPH
ncbi:unnamed protein product [Spirodela intermedia]|uniref:Bifunctional inhibitor/plant lipid transfer protein/seed storage helical domain-containing protein n=1 Tax=Spirodela intermedia TaxID=51605 RepID=A0A7I8IM68_SPIIN|nr:unnamed protein product [Spirodela intermedia]CAA6659047.1 unnamed protein product [Spirodela intermedia]